MAHIQTARLGLWKPQDLTVDKINSQKMFVDNIDALDNFAKVTMQKMHASVKSLTELRAIDTSDTVLFSTGMLIMVQENGMYSFNRSSTANDDNSAIITPTTGGGRWITTQITDIALSSKKVANNTEFDTLLTNTVEQMATNSIKFLTVSGSSASEHPLYGKTGHITIYKAGNQYVSVTMVTYDHYDAAMLYYTRTRYNGIWGRWVTLPYLDANGKIPLSQLPSSVLPASIE